MVRKPFVEKNWAERKAQPLRQRMNLAASDILNPYELMDDMGLALLPFEDIKNLSPKCVERLLKGDPRGWSALAIEHPSEGPAVVFNPTHSDERLYASLMEEVSHFQLKHRPSKLTVIEDGIAFRSFDPQQELEAYSVGAAALVPMSQLEDAQSRGMDRQSLAYRCGVSEELVRFRANMTGIKLPASMPVV